MDLLHIGLFDLAERRLAWLGKRQELLAQNVSNANTPGFKPRDLKPFAAALSQLSAMSPTRTQPAHLQGFAGAGGPLSEVVAPSAMHAPDGNAVALDSQLMKVADSVTTQALVTTIYKKYLGLFSLALGRGTSG